MFRGDFMAECARINITINKGLLEKLDDYADSVNITRSGAISMIVSEYLNTKKTVATLEDLMEIYKREQERKGSPI